MKTCSFFYSIASPVKASLLVKLMGFLVFLSVQSHAVNKDEWREKPRFSQEFYPIVFPDAANNAVYISDSAQSIFVVNDDGVISDFQSRATGTVPDTEIDESLRSPFSYPLTNNNYVIGGFELRVATVGGSGYPTFNNFLTRGNMRGRHQFMLDRAEADRRFDDWLSSFQSIRLDDDLLARAGNDGGVEHLYNRLIRDDILRPYFYNDQGDFNEAVVQFRNNFYNPVNREFIDSLTAEPSDAIRLSPSFEQRATALAGWVVNEQTEVLNIVRTTAEELKAIIDDLSSRAGVESATLVVASQDGDYQTSIEDVMENSSRIDEATGRSRGRMISDAFIQIQYSGSPNRIAQPVMHDEVTAVRGYSGNQNRPAAIEFPAQGDEPGVVFISSLTGPAASEGRQGHLDNINRIQQAHSASTVIITSYTYKSDTRDSERDEMLRMREGGEELTDTAMSSFYLGFGADLYGADDEVLKMFISILIKRWLRESDANSVSEALNIERADDDSSNYGHFAEPENVVVDAGVTKGSGI